MTTSVPKFLFLSTKSTLLLGYLMSECGLCKPHFCFASWLPIKLYQLQCVGVSVFVVVVYVVFVYMWCVYVVMSVYGDVCGVCVHGRVFLCLVICVCGMCICVCGMYVGWYVVVAVMCVGGGVCLHGEVIEGECQAEGERRNYLLSVCFLFLGASTQQHFCTPRWQFLLITYTCTTLTTLLISTLPQRYPGPVAWRPLFRNLSFSSMWLLHQAFKFSYSHLSLCLPSPRGGSCFL